MGTCVGLILISYVFSQTIFLFIKSLNSLFILPNSANYREISYNSMNYQYRKRVATPCRCFLRYATAVFIEESMTETDDWLMAIV